MQREGNHYHLLLTKRVNDNSYLSSFYNCFSWLCFGFDIPENNNNDIKDKQNAWLLVKLVYLYFDLNWEQPRAYNLNPCTLYLAF